MKIVINNFFLKEDGYTLLEIVVAFSIFTVLIASVYATFFSQYSRFSHQRQLAEMVSDSARALRMIQEVVDDYGDISVSGSQIYSSGEVIIDLDTDSSLEGSELSLNHRDSTLVNSNGRVVASNISDIKVLMGPGSMDDVTVVNGVILLKIHMEKGNLAYALKGGVNAER